MLASAARPPPRSSLKRDPCSQTRAQRRGTAAVLPLSPGSVVARGGLCGGDAWAAEPSPAEAPGLRAPSVPRARRPSCANAAWLTSCPQPRAGVQVAAGGGPETLPLSPGWVFSQLTPWLVVSLPKPPPK